MLRIRFGKISLVEHSTLRSVWTRLSEKERRSEGGLSLVGAVESGPTEEFESGRPGVLGSGQMNQF